MRQKLSTLPAAILKPGADHRVQLVKEWLSAVSGNAPKAVGALLARLSALVGDAPKVVAALMALMSKTQDARRDPPEPDECSLLLGHLAALDKQARSDVACGLSVLWEDFLKRHDGVSGYLELPERDREAYLALLRGMGSSIQRKDASSKGHISMAPDLMWRYLTLIGKRSLTSSEAKLGDAVAQLITIGVERRRSES